MWWTWIAAAVAMVAAMPATAARYVELQVIGSTTPTYYDPYGINPPVTYRRVSTFLVSVDTTAGGAPYPFQFGLQDQDVALTRDLGHLFTLLPRPGDTFFDLSFDPSGLRAGTEFQQVAATGSYGYTNCSNRYRVCTQTLSGSYVLLARTGDTAPAFIGAREFTELLAVPEPAAWAMMIVGVGLIGGDLRRRRTAPEPQRLVA